MSLNIIMFSSVHKLCHAGASVVIEENVFVSGVGFSFPLLFSHILISLEAISKSQMTLYILETGWLNIIVRNNKIF